MEHFFSPSSGKDQKKVFTKTGALFSRILVETCAQTHTLARSQKFAMGGCLGVWGRSPQPPEANGRRKVVENQRSSKGKESIQSYTKYFGVTLKHSGLPFKFTTNSRFDYL